MSETNRIKQAIPVATLLVPRSQLDGPKIEKVPPVSADAGASPNALAYAWLNQLMSRQSAPRSPASSTQAPKTTIQLNVPTQVISPKSNLSDQIASVFAAKSSGFDSTKKAPAGRTSFRAPILRA